NKDTALVFREKAKKENAPIHFASKHIRLTAEQKTLFKQTFTVKMNQPGWPKKVTTDLTGPYQKQNVTTVLESIWCWNKYYPEKSIPEQAVRRGLAAVVSMTGLMGRWMIMHQKPLVIADAAHNEHGMKAMLPQLLSIRAKQRHFVLGFVSDKDVQKILKLFPADGKYYWCAPDIPRGKRASETQNIARDLNLIGNAYQSVAYAFRAAMKEASPGDLIFVGGSSYVVGDFLHKKTLQR
ncbi:MAG TPA: hypothetical protein VJ508_02635, partial [Saprospiraceae bacterium]|nr:hypothetical protein [Saprospiraceae bacterium]